MSQLKPDIEAIELALNSGSREEQGCRRMAIARFFEQRRLESGLETEVVAELLELESATTLLGYEAGRIAIPLEDVFALTNLLNIPPEDVFALINDVYCHPSQK